MINRTRWGYVYEYNGLTVDATEWLELVRMLRGYGIEVVIKRESE